MLTCACVHALHGQSSYLPPPPSSTYPNIPHIRNRTRTRTRTHSNVPKRAVVLDRQQVVAEVWPLVHSVALCNRVTLCGTLYVIQLRLRPTERIDG